MSGKEPQARSIVQRMKDIPVFHDEAEEHAFWAEHEFSDDLWERAEPFAPDELPLPRPATKSKSI